MDEPHSHLTARHGAEALKEPVHVTFTGLAVLLAMRSHATEMRVVEAVATLAIAVAGTLLASPTSSPTSPCTHRCRRG